MQSLKIYEYSVNNSCENISKILSPSTSPRHPRPPHPRTLSPPPVALHVRQRRAYYGCQVDDQCDTVTRVHFLHARSWNKPLVCINHVLGIRILVLFHTQNRIYACQNTFYHGAIARDAFWSCPELRDLLADLRCLTTFWVVGYDWLLTESWVKLTPRAVLCPREPVAGGSLCPREPVAGGSPLRGHRTGTAQLAYVREYTNIWGGVIFGWGLLF